MSQREDADYIKSLSKVNKDVLEWAILPLIVMDKDSEVSKVAQTSARTTFNTLQDNTYRDTDLFSGDIAIPVSDFVFLNKAVELRDGTGMGSIKHHYMRVIVSDLCIRIYYPTLAGEVSELHAGNGAQQYLTYIHGGEVITLNPSKHLTDIKIFMTAMLITLLAFFKALNDSDLYPVSSRGVQHRKVHAKKPWMRKDLVTIQFLNSMPRGYSEPKGGTHSSPQYHQRRGTWRDMSNPRFKNHKKYGDRIWVKPCWVGDKTAVVNGITYKVL